MATQKQDVTTTTALTMSSKDIADLTGKRHDNVLRDIRDMLMQVYDLIDNSDLSYQQIQGVTKEHDEQTKRVSMYYLDKNHTLTLLTGYDAKARFNVVKRWQELENQLIAPVPAQQQLIFIEYGQMSLPDIVVAAESERNILNDRLQKVKNLAEAAKKFYTAIQTMNSAGGVITSAHQDLITVLQMKGKPVLESEIMKACYSRAAFKNHDGNRADYIRQLINDLAAIDIVTKRTTKNGAAEITLNSFRASEVG